MHNSLRSLLAGALALLTATTAARAQSVGIGTPTPNASAALDVSSTSQGFLPPRLTYAQRTGIANAVAGLLVYQSNANASPAAPAGYYYYTGSAWLPLSQGDNLGNHTATQDLNLNGNQLSGGASNNVGLLAGHTLELGNGVAGKESNAGKIGYNAFGSGALDIVGAGTSNTIRKIKLWAEGGTEINTLAGTGTRVVAADASGNLGSSAATALLLAENGVQVVGGKLGLGGALARDTNIDLSGQQLSFGPGSSTGIPPVLTLSQGNSLPLVGIGTASPGTALDVQGQIWQQVFSTQSSVSPAGSVTIFIGHLLGYRPVWMLSVEKTGGSTIEYASLSYENINPLQTIITLRNANPNLLAGNASFRLHAIVVGNGN